MWNTWWINDILAITLLLPRGKWWLRALGLVSYQAGSHVTFQIHLMQGYATFDTLSLLRTLGMRQRQVSNHSLKPALALTVSSYYTSLSYFMYKVLATRAPIPQVAKHIHQTYSAFWRHTGVRGQFTYCNFSRLTCQGNRRHHHTRMMLAHNNQCHSETATRYRGHLEG